MVGTDYLSTIKTFQYCLFHNVVESQYTSSISIKININDELSKYFWTQFIKHF